MNRPMDKRPPIPMRHIIAVALASALAGCSSTPVIVKAYQGGAQAPQSMAVVKPVAFISIDKIDGLPYNIFPSGQMVQSEYEVELLPGQHVFVVGYSDGVRDSSGSLQLQGRVEAGRRYILRPDVQRHAWKPKLVDVTSKPECWTISVGTTFGPKGCD